MAAMALGSAARAHVRTIDLDSCSAGCSASPTEEPPVAKGGAASKITLSRSGGGAAHPNEPNPTVVFDRRTAPAALTSGLPSPLATADAVLGGVTPYDYFEDVIDIPLSAEARAEFAAVPFFLFAPSLLGRLTFTDVLSAGSAFFGRYSPHSPPPPM
jgi:hypothetical protein